jgi:tetratricopeptide (TPR) repeat protein
MYQAEFEHPLRAPGLEGGGAGADLSLGQAGKQRGRWLPRLAVTGLLTMIGLAGARAGAQSLAYYHLQAARQDLASYRFTEARGRLAYCLKVWPADPETLLLAARAARRAGDLAEADRLLMLCRQADLPQAVELERALCRAQAGTLTAGRAALWELAEQDPSTAPLILEALCWGYVHSQRWPETLTTAIRLLEAAPDHPVAVYWKGLALDNTGQLARAKDCYEQVLARDPRHEEARTRLAFIHLTFNQFPQAAVQFEYLRQQRPHDLGILGGLATCRRYEARWAEAGALLDALLAERPDSAPALAERGRLALDQDRPDEAEGWLRRALALNPHDGMTHYTLYLCLCRLHKEQEADRCREQFVRLDADARRLEVVMKEVLHHPDDRAVRCEAGVLLLHTGHTEKGLSMLANILQEDPHHAAAHEALADYYRGQGDELRAERHRRLARRGGARAGRPNGG